MNKIADDLISTALGVKDFYVMSTESDLYNQISAIDQEIFEAIDCKEKIYSLR